MGFQYPVDGEARVVYMGDQAISAFRRCATGASIEIQHRIDYHAVTGNRIADHIGDRVAGLMEKRLHMGCGHCRSTGFLRQAML
jgi:hypothetical protein